MNVLITGALGHIGSHFIRNLNRAVFGAGKIILLDNLESRRYPSLYGLPKGFKFKFIQDDILTADWDNYLKDIDIVIHLAAITDAEGSYKIPEKVEQINYDGLKRVADACLRNKVKILFPSTTSVYGSQAFVVDEACKELKPQSPYAWTKLNSERYLRKLDRKGLKFVICRFGTIFGHSIGMRFDTAVNKFVWQAATGLPLSVWKTAWSQKRPYLDLDDCIKAINFIVKKDLFGGETYNVLTENLTVKDVVKTIKKFIPSLTVNYVDSPIMNQLSYEVDDSKFRKLGFKPEGNLLESLRNKTDQFKGLLT